MAAPRKTGTEVTIDYRRTEQIPAWVKEVIETHLAIEAEDAKSADALGFMTRALVLATMPYKDPKADAFTRTNGDFRLRIVAGYEGGIPYGIYPRLLMSWVTTEAARTKSREIELGDSLARFLRNVLNIQRGGGLRGSSTRVAEQMRRLFGSMITAHYSGSLSGRGFSLRNVLIADSLDVGEDFEDQLGLEPPRHQAAQQEATVPNDGHPHFPDEFWTPQKTEVAGQWNSKLRLTERFFTECVDRPVPIDLRAYQALRGSPLAMDVYTWLTYRMSYTERRSRPIRWEALMGQFGSNYTTPSAVADFKKAFLKALKMVTVVYPKANLEVTDKGLILLPSPPHVLSKQAQPDLF